MCLHIFTSKTNAKATKKHCLSHVQITRHGSKREPKQSLANILTTHSYATYHTYIRMCVCVCTLTRRSNAHSLINALKNQNDRCWWQHWRCVAAADSASRTRRGGVVMTTMMNTTCAHQSLSSPTILCVLLLAIWFAIIFSCWFCFLLFFSLEFDLVRNVF